MTAGTSEYLEYEREALAEATRSPTAEGAESLRRIAAFWRTLAELVVDPANIGAANEN